MELDLEKIEATQRTFNEKYGVNFSISEFNDQMRALTDNGVINKESDWDVQYRTEFIKMMKKAFDNHVDFKIAQFDPKEMLNDFETMIMEPYRQECKEKKVVGPRKNANWSDKDFYKRVQDEFKDIPNHKWDYAIQRYLNGKLRVRDVRAYRAQIDSQSGFPSKEKLSTLICYQHALEHAVNKRSLWFRIRHPFKSSAEKTELNELKDFIVKKIPGVFNAEEVDETRTYIEAEKISENKTIGNFKANVAECVKEASVEKVVDSEPLNLDHIFDKNDKNAESEQILDTSVSVKDNVKNF